MNVADTKVSTASDNFEVTTVSLAEEHAVEEWQAGKQTKNDVAETEHAAENQTSGNATGNQHGVVVQRPATEQHSEDDVASVDCGRFSLQMGEPVTFPPPPPSPLPPLPPLPSLPLPGTAGAFCSRPPRYTNSSSGPTSVHGSYSISSGVETYCVANAGSSFDANEGNNAVINAGNTASASEGNNGIVRAGDNGFVSAGFNAGANAGNNASANTVNNAGANTGNNASANTGNKAGANTFKNAGINTGNNAGAKQTPSVVLSKTPVQPTGATEHSASSLAVSQPTPDPPTQRPPPPPPPPPLPLGSYHSIRYCK